MSGKQRKSLSTEKKKGKKASSYMYTYSRPLSHDRGCEEVPRTRSADQTYVYTYVYLYT